jgi:hypothetical protein
MMCSSVPVSGATGTRGTEARDTGSFEPGTLDTDPLNNGS